MLQKVSKSHPNTCTIHTSTHPNTHPKYDPPANPYLPPLAADPDASEGQ